MRAFVAVTLTDPDLLTALDRLREELLREEPTLKPSSHAHFTLQFLGEVPDNTVEQTEEALSSLSFSSFSLTVQGMGAFPNTASSRVLWAGVGEGKQQLISLAKQVNTSLAPLGLLPDKPFVPHLTLFRVKHPLSSDIIGPHKEREFGTQRIDKITLYKSELAPGGPVYTSLFDVGSKV